MKLRSAIIGLGKIGIDFDLKENRSKKDDLWTHYAAYKSLADKFDLVAAVEVNDNKIKEVSKYDPQLKIVRKIEDLIDLNIDVVSICTPEFFHLQNIEECLKFVKGIFVEKPLLSSKTNIDILAFQKFIQQTGKPVYVNYYKRQEPSVIELITYLKTEKIKSIICKYSGLLDAVGSHAIDLINFIKPIKSIGFVHHNLIGSSALLLCEDNILSYLNHTGDKNKLIFELEVVTENYRFLLEDNLATFKVQKFGTSDRYKNYSELKLENEKKYFTNPHRLIGFLNLIHQNITTKKIDLTNFIQSIESQYWLTAIQNKNN